MEPITVREAQRSDKEALARIHAEVARYYLDRAPDYLQVLQRFAEQLASETPAIDSATLHLVAEAEGQVVGALVARLLPPEDAANGRSRRSSERPVCGSSISPSRRQVEGKASVPAL